MDSEKEIEIASTLETIARHLQEIKLEATTGDNHLTLIRMKNDLNEIKETLREILMHLKKNIK